MKYISIHIENLTIVIIFLILVAYLTAHFLSKERGREKEKGHVFGWMRRQERSGRSWPLGDMMRIHCMKLLYKVKIQKKNLTRILKGSS